MAFFSWGSKQAEAPKATDNKTTNPLNPEGIKPCCACPQTKSARDECFFNTDPSEADDKCKALVQAHIDCMASYGFKI